MRYRPTVLNLFSIGLILYDSYIYLADYLEGEIYEYGFVALALTFIIGIIFLVIDFTLQKFIRSYWIINGIGLLILSIFTFFYFYNSREKTIILPDDYTGSFTIVYGVEGEDPLTHSGATFGYNIEVSENSILYTETLMKDDIWNTEFKNRSGSKLPRDKKFRRVIDGRVGDFNCRDEEWKYRTWRVDSIGQLSGTKEIDSVTIQNIINYCNYKSQGH